MGCPRALALVALALLTLTPAYAVGWKNDALKAAKGIAHCGVEPNGSKHSGNRDAEYRDAMRRLMVYTCLEWGAGAQDVIQALEGAYANGFTADLLRQNLIDVSI